MWRVNWQRQDAETYLKMCKKISLTHTCKELQKPSVTKTHSVGLNHNPELKAKNEFKW